MSSPIGSTGACWREGELFGFVLQRAVQGEPFPYARLVAEAAG